MFLATPEKFRGEGLATAKKLSGKPNFRRPASPSRWRRRGTTSCWGAGQLRGGALLAWDALHVPGGGAIVVAHKIAAVVALGHSSLLSSLAAAAGARHLPTSEISLFPPFAEIREIIPEMAFSRGILGADGAQATGSPWQRASGLRRRFGALRALGH